MPIHVISYSLTGNNEALAAGVACALSAVHGRVTEARSRSMLTTMLDLTLRRAPKVLFPVDGVGKGDAIVFVAPVWAGMVATPLRRCLETLGPQAGTCAFVSISGGALGPNPRLADELTRRIGKPPVAVVDLHIAELLELGRKPTAKDTSAYRLSERDVAALTEKAVAALRPALAAAKA